MLKKILALVAMLYAAASFAAVDVNKASAAELDGIKGIGPAISAKIVDERKKGNFKDWSDFISRVKGVGEGNAAKFSADGLTVNGAAFKGAAAAPADKKAEAKPTPAAAAAPAAKEEKKDPKAEAKMKADEAKAKKGADKKAKAEEKAKKAEEAKAKKEADMKAKEEAKKAAAAKKDEKKAEAPKAAASAAKK
ncbi:MAG: helix-hairpin-helix domain-containing protein [Ramlibacter sp.]|nr:helix-hairpin-helix domain-containing protein [Ramlibacter sp.]